MKTTLGVALTPPTAAALIAGACLLAAAFLPSCHARDKRLLPIALAPASACPPKPAPKREPLIDPLDEAYEAAQAAHGAPVAAAVVDAGHAASGQP
ncbi:hypothetical protein J5226_13920 [Lysobacter sp. K5869]|uniref:hypothetical protein n=1 Tax=Lysobacter sp. K5869 TaxID=2820808 RepID=UPI001C06089D|nr:hypothetical protein [Lysobacter sp. K5869]QWP74765.1 hypothetical protein J5226_13920 [Lysobacter sp. K5869]